jgi:O-antigen ligase
MSLVRIENLSNKDAGRLNLYKKGVRMVEAHPLVGNGIGSFYLTSVKYSEADDPWAKRPDFGHNTFLQFAAELGVPAACLFFFVVVLAVKQSWQMRASDTSAVPGAAAALIAYLLTQMTANSLNVYFSNQFLFWFLAAVLIKGPSKTQIRIGGRQISDAYRRIS